jgi:hypothetical protein
VTGADDGEPLPTWEQLVSGAGLGVAARPRWRLGTSTARHAGAWSGEWTDDWEVRWAELVHELHRDVQSRDAQSRDIQSRDIQGRDVEAGTPMSWREAWAWTSVAVACTAAASSATGLLR